MKTVPAVIRLYLAETRNPVLIFGSVLLAIFIATFAMLVYYEGGIVNLGGVTSIYIFCFVTSILSLNEPLPFLLGMNIRRVDFFKATIAYFTILAVFFSICITLLSVIERSLNSRFSTHLYFFSQFIDRPYTIVYEFFAHLLTILILMSLGFFIAALYYRAGRLGVFLLFTIAFLFIMFAGVFLGVSFEPLLNAPWKIAVNGCLIALVFATGSYVLIRRAPAKI